MLTLRDIQQGTCGTISAPHSVDLEQRIERVTIDSRLVRPGDLFVAIRGERVDGHDYVGAAISAGAVAALVSQLPALRPIDRVAYILVDDTVRALGELARYWRRKVPARVVGVTGSVGKTSTKEVLASVLAGRFTTMRSEKNLNNEIGLPLALLSLRPEVEVAVLEMGGAYAMGEIEFLCSLAVPSVGVVTNVGYSHIGRMGSLERIAETKSELVACLPTDGVAVLNADDSLVRGMADRARCPVLWYGLDPSADIRADEVESRGLEGIGFRLHLCGRSHRVRSPLLGRHSVHTALAAVAVAHWLGMDTEEILARVAALSPSLRLVVNKGINGSRVIDDTYNASPASMLAALNLLDEMDGRKVAVLGDMAELGPYAPEAHRQVGARAGRVCDLLFLVGPLSMETGRAAVDAGMDPAAVRHFDTASPVADELKDELRAGDTVLLKGSRVTALDKLAAAVSLREEGQL